MIRPATVAAIAWRDLRLQLVGRRAWALPLIAAVLLVPLSTVRLGGAPRPRAPGAAVVVQGELPAGIAADPRVQASDDRGPAVRRDGDTWIVVADPVPAPLRAALDEALDPAPPPKIIGVSPPPLPLPGRTLLLALVTASLLTGAVSESLPGERGSRTLEALLTAAVRRDEIILGKWAAWGGLGAATAALAGLMAWLTGIAPAGPWWIALPLVPPATVALGLYLVRHTADLVGGATVSLRVLPAVLSILGLVAWTVGLWSPAAAAAIPLGGALVAAGGTWPGWGPPAIAVASTGLATAALLALAARDLGREARSEAAASRLDGLANVTWAAAIVWGLSLGPRIWAPAGNAPLADALDPAMGALATAAGLAMLAALRVVGPAGWAGVGLAGRPAASWALGLALAPLVVAAAVAPMPPWFGDAGVVARLDLGLAPGGAGPMIAVALILAQELVFRGMMPRAFAGGRPPGPIAEALAVAAWVAVVMPHRPVAGLVVGLALAFVARATGSIVPGVIGRALGVVALAWLAG
jgi:hypothetical protein